MPEVNERLRLLSLLAAIGELSASTANPEDGVELLDQERSMRWFRESSARPFGSFTSLKFNGYVGEEDDLHKDLQRLVEKDYVGLSPMHDTYGLTPAGLAVYQGRAEFA